MATSNTSRGMLYRISSPTIALVPESGKPVAQMIPRGAKITIPEIATQMGTTEPGLDLVEAHWEGKDILMFAKDVRERAEQVKAGKR